MSKTYEGYLLIADITGYTRYLSESELDHAQDTLTALLQLLVENTRSPLVISRLAGDAVISYALREDFFIGQSFVEKIEDTYVTFRKTLERLVLNNTCRCNACANIANLDLKFFIHFGTFGIQHISDHDELVGTDVNLLHRLLKNSVSEETSLRAYALYTDISIQQLGIEDLGEVMTPHRETYAHLGEVSLLIQDMQKVWEAKRDAVAVEFPLDDLVDRSEVFMHIPRERVWDYITQPVFRSILIGADQMEIVNRASGRIAPGSVYQCYHGDKWAPHVILEWQTFERLITRESTPMFPDLNAIVEYRLESIEGGTRLTKLFAKPKGPILARTLFRLLAPMFGRVGKKSLETFRQEVEKDYRAHAEATKENPEFSEEQIRMAAAVSLQEGPGSQNI